MKLEVNEVTTVCREVEIPERCPGCSADLHDGRIVCEQLEYTEQIATTRRGEIVEWGSRAMGGTPEYITNGWRCLDCGHVLARGE